MINSLAAIAGELMFQDDEYIQATRDRSARNAPPLLSDNAKFQAFPSIQADCEFYAHAHYG